MWSSPFFFSKAATRLDTLVCRIDFDPENTPSDPSRVFTKIYQSLPTKHTQTIEQRVEDIANALIWMRQQGLENNFDHGEECPCQSLDNVSLSATGAGVRAKDMGDALSWVRSQKNDMLDEPDGESARLDGVLPRRKDQSHEGRARDLESSLIG